MSPKSLSYKLISPMLRPHSLKQAKMGSGMANRFQRTRDDHRKEIAEDYVELIHALTQDNGEARSVELAERLGVSRATVAKTIQRLTREGYIASQPYRSLFLTEMGEALANESRERHELVLEFLKKLGVPDHVAEPDAEGIEHHVSTETLEAMKRFISQQK